MSFAEYYGFRRTLVDALEADIVGPVGGENEVIDDAPITKYIAGILYPAGADPIDFSQDVDEAEDEGETAMPDPPVALANRRYPSSMGMTFAVDSNASPKIQVELGAARYVPILVESDSRGQGKWKREPLGIPPLELVVNVQEAGRRVPVDEGLELFFRVRSADKEGRVSVTLVLINRQTAGPGPGERDRSSFFQPYIRVVALNVAKGAFVERPSIASPVNDEDIRTYSLLYRKRREFAVGHGCSVRWDTAEDTARATRIETTYTPEFELALADSNPMIKSSALTMQFLVDSPKAKALDELRDFCEQYGKWIQSCKQEANTLPANLKITAEAHLEQCSEAYRRMRSGVEVLGEDSLAWQAFRLANKAMLQQRARTVWLHSGKPSGGPVEDRTALWRPFQLAFFLLCLEGIVRTESPDRIMTDLLWFPTGGGKTEAYLGLIAFTVFLRRLRYKDGGGVTALMRYTLRLLTVQQFERAALLICCCETVRQAEGNLGTDPISLGLWVGLGATPNTRKEAQTALNKIALTKQTPPEGSPIQIHVCPWCGTELDYRNYSIQKMPGRMMIACKTPGCAFRDGLPVFVIDEDVYDFRPTLIISTVDKFASLPWKDRVASLFNLQHGGQVSARRPELIIQDELHLISGPLGTLVGLYETAVDLLCTDDGIRPKVIASTATIRRAQDQANHLFNREVRQFPPPALDAGDSYFAVEVGPEAKGNRMYIGLMAPGTSQTTLLVRTYAALLQKAFEIPGPDNIKDPYWTLVGYFNSLRVLGGARMQVQDDVNDRIGLLARQSGASEREIESVIELTSREPSSSIPDHLKHMAMSLPAPNTLDVILATNMISVGVDIDRLGLMVVMGQPQSTSEYIQSTSRVGRKWPGLVVTLLNSARSRDRSHYESFVAYHSALYRQVEAASVTPFSARARDRGLHSVIVALSRLLLPSFRSNDSARNILSRRSDVEDIAERILERVDAVSEDEVASTRKQIEELLDRWASLAETKPGLTYADLGDPQNSLLVDAAIGESMPELEDHFAALWSLRDVDKECQLQIVSGDGGQHNA